MSLDVIIRFHDASRIDELARAVFSAALQDYRPLAIQLVCQRIPPDGQRAIRAALDPILSIVPEVGFTLLNHAAPEPADARAALLNLGLRAGQGGYVCFLDYDDLAYPEGGRLLIGELQAADAAIAFGGILNADVDRDGVMPMTVSKRRVFHGDGLPRLLENNFCPLHSFVIDRARVDAADLVVDESLATLEDYDLLLRLCAKYPASFRLKDKIVGEYLFKNDHSNLNPLAQQGGGSSRWRQALAAIEARKARLAISPSVQADLGVNDPGLTVGSYLARYRPGPRE